MHVIFKTEHGEIIATSFTDAYIEPDMNSMFVNIHEVDVKNHQGDQIFVDTIEATVAYDESKLKCSVWDSNTNFNVAIEILEMQPDMRKYL